MSLPIPHINRTPSVIKRSGSASSLGNGSIEHEHDLAPVIRGSRRGSTSSVNTSAATAPLSLAQPPIAHAVAQTTLYAGKSHKATVLPTHALMTASPYFQKLLSETPEPLPEQTTFEDADEASMALFGHYVTGKKLGGPTDFHSCGHYLGLYVLGQKFGCEGLENDVMDHTRTYYHTSTMTASPFRCQYIYTYTPGPNLMRKFLISTAAWRALYDHTSKPEHNDETTNTDTPGLSTAMMEVLAKDPIMSADFMHALIEFGRQVAGDPREGGRCVWHVHEGTSKCVEEGLEPWEKD
ncbi:hypothetical protein LTR86_006249 [Recurvomyces mirabilis]|nr:hypothetical protein LTR86_006249 [Recurvomyces mirabilis]